MNVPQLLSPQKYAGVLFAAAFLAAATPATYAQISPTLTARQYDHGVVINAPSSLDYSKQNELRLTFDTRWANNHGYRPIRVRVRSRQAAQSEKRITFRLHVSGPTDSPLEVEQSFDLPQGSREATAIVRLPELFGDDRCWWDVWVDGVRDRELSIGEAESWNLSPAGTTRSMGTTLALIQVREDAQPRRLISSKAEPFSASTVAVEDLPTAWIDYSALDVVALTPRELSKLESTRPEAFSALKRWVRAGGQLWVCSVGAEVERLADVERCLDLKDASPLPRPYDTSEGAAAAGKAENEKSKNLAARGWRPQPITGGDLFQAANFRHKATGRIETARDAATITRLKLDPEYEPAEGPAPSSSAGAIRDSANWFLDRPVGLGRVRLLRGEFDPVGFSMAYRLLGGGLPNQPPFEPVPATPVTTAVATTRDWPKRHGMVPDMPSIDFADFLVPGMGLAPVSEFRVLITLFVLVIGPLNYWLLLRANRLHLLLLTVPAMALGLTAALFGYALLSDGLGTVVRARSFTSLDQSTGEAASWARLSYYAGLAPGEGLTVDDDVAIYPILSEWGTSRERESDNRQELRQRDGRQQFTKGWLRSRVPTQFLTVRARKSPMHVDFARTENQLLATNKLGTRILYLAVVDDAGSVFTGEAIDDGEKVELHPSTHSDAIRVLRDWMLKNQPQMPIELAVSRATNPRRGARPPRPFGGPANPEELETRMSDNVLNTAIADLVAGNADGVLNVPRRSYVAITETGPEIELGVAGATEEASFHVLQGSW